VIIAPTSPDSTGYAIDVLAGELQAKGALTYNVKFNKKGDLPYEALLESCANGVSDTENTGEAEKRALKYQHGMVNLNSTRKISPEEEKDFERADSGSITEICDKDIPKALDRNGKYYFTVLTEKKIDLKANPEDAKSGFSNKWFDPFAVADKLKELFPNSIVDSISEFPTPSETHFNLNRSYGYESVFVTYICSDAYTGTEEFTPRISSLFTAMQISDRISTLVHFGNPYPLEQLPHIPRIIIGTCSEKSVEHGLDVLAGNLEAHGTLNRNVKLK
jgi:hypothetical protein